MAMDKKQIKLFITAETKKAVKALNKVEKSQKGLKKNNDKLKSSFSAMGGAIVAAFSVRAIVEFGKEAVKLGSQTISLNRAFRNLGNSVGFTDKSLGKFRKATNGTVTDIDLMTQANNAMLLGIVQSDDQFADLIDNAQRLAQAVGKDAIFGIESLTTGIGRQSKLMLDNLGIIVDTQKAYDVYAESIGKSTSQLDDNEKKQAFIQATMESVREKVAQLGKEELTAADATNQLATAFTNLQGVMGQDLQDPVEATSGLFTNFLNVTSMLVKEFGLLNLLVGQIPQTAFVPLPKPERPDAQFTEESEEDILPDFELKISLHEQYLESIGELDNNALDFRIAGYEEDFFVQDAFRKKNEDAVKRLRKEERVAHQEKIKNNLQAAILSGQSAKEAAQSVIKAEVAESQASLISSIMTKLPFPINLAVAAGAGSMIGKVTDQLLSFPTGGSFVTKGRTTLPIGNGVTVGDNASGMERIDVTPLPSPTSSGSNITININAPLVDEFVVDSIIPAIRRAEQLNL